MIQEFFVMGWWWWHHVQVTCFCYYLIRPDTSTKRLTNKQNKQHMCCFCMEWEDWRIQTNDTSNTSWCVDEVHVVCTVCDGIRGLTCTYKHTMLYNHIISNLLTPDCRVCQMWCFVWNLRGLTCTYNDWHDTQQRITWYKQTSWRDINDDDIPQTRIHVLYRARKC